MRHSCASDPARCTSESGTVTGWMPELPCFPEVHGFSRAGSHLPVNAGVGQCLQLKFSGSLVSRATFRATGFSWHEDVGLPVHGRELGIR